jgi:hypothetical protein
MLNTTIFQYMHAVDYEVNLLLVIANPANFSMIPFPQTS